MSQELMKVDEHAIAAQKAQLEIAMTAANQNKRDVGYFVESATRLATFNQEVAASCNYAIPRKKKNEKTGQYEKTFIRGKSIRLAEIFLATYTNLSTRTRIAQITPKYVIIAAEAWDLEARTYVSADVMENINGTHSDAVKLAVASGTSKALRNIIFKLIPGSICDQIAARAMEAAVGTQKTLADVRAEVFAKLNKMGIQNERVFEFFDKTAIEDFTKEDIKELIAIGTAIKEGSVNIDEAFTEEKEKENKADEVNNLLASS